jgi:membrane protein YdbS with pleckstrin-like domain
MKFDWKNMLSENEHVVKEFGISNLYLGIIFVITTIVAIFVIYSNIFIAAFVSLLGTFYCYYLKRSRHYAFTNKRIILVDSFIGTNIVSVNYEKITDVEIDQSPVDQILGWGALIVNTAGTHSSFLSMPYVENPQALKQVLVEAQG